uniref:Uncharacterized protein n=1 Tax=Timema poppense TaxID=170557 RepID=A0A7R9D5C6_TIMPO|nr:unnamed protein product [Timema poppensis]
MASEHLKYVDAINKILIEQELRRVFLALWNGDVTREECSSQPVLVDLDRSNSSNSNKDRSRHCESNNALSLPGSLALLPTPSYGRMRTTIKQHVNGTVKRTVSYKDVCIFFINWGMLLKY